MEDQEEGVGVGGKENKKKGENEIKSKDLWSGKRLQR